MPQTIATNWHRGLLVAAASLMATGVALGAFGAHALDGLVQDGTLPAARLDTFETGVRYQLIHGLGLFAIAALVRDRRPGWLLLAGTVVFAGSLYLLVLTDTPWLGAVAPIGGAAMIAGWCWAAWALARGANPRG